jgi:hypothetical protein
MTKDGMKRYLTFYDQGFGKPSALEFVRFTRTETIPRAAFDKKES